MSSNFASHKFADRVHRIPALMSTIRELIEVAKAEINEFKEISSLFDEVVNSYVRLVLNTVQNLEVTLPYLRTSVTYMQIVRDTLMSPHDEDLSEQDDADIKTAFLNMFAGIEKIREYARESKQERDGVDERIECLKENMESKIEVIGSRISFSRIIPKIGASTG